MEKITILMNNLGLIDSDIVFVLPKNVSATIITKNVVMVDRKRNGSDHKSLNTLFQSLTPLFMTI